MEGRRDDECEWWNQREEMGVSVMEPRGREGMMVGEWRFDHKVGEWVDLHEMIGGEGHERRSVGPPPPTP